MNTKEMLETYPELFGTELSPKKSLMVFGIEAGKGWKDIVLSYLPKISKIVKENNIDDFRIVQIKEKFGSLRIYTMGNSNEDIKNLISEMEEKCSYTCEKCGSKEGILRTNGWVRVICDECEEKQRIENEV
jgi:hypothetical protein